MTKRIVFENNMGGISVTALATNASCTLEELAKRVVPEGNHYSFIDEDLIPDDRTFREAWNLSDNVVEVSMTKAKDIWRDKIREDRKPKLAELDVQYMRAVENDDATEKAAIATKKQTLRDATADSRIDAATTPDELKLVDPVGDVDV